VSKRTKIILIVVAVAVAGYLVYKYLANKSGSTSSTTGTALGTNLNSVAPELVAGSSGPSSGLNYTAPATTIYLTMPNSTAKSTDITSTPTGKSSASTNTPG
jgi:hypothetical protein